MVSHPSSLCAVDRVNDDPDSSLHARRRRRCLRRILEIERKLRAFVPRPMLIPPAKPIQADRVLDALADVHKPGDCVGNREIASAAGTSLLVASRVRRWARSAGLWPYRDAATGFGVLADRRRKGGAL